MFENDKEKFVKLVTTQFIEVGNSMTSEEFARHIKEYVLKYFPLLMNDLENLNFNSKDDQYGTLTLTIPAKPNTPAMEFQLRKPNAYEGPKTHNYIDRIELKVEAAITLIDPNDTHKIEKLNQLLKNYRHLLLTTCQLKPELLRNLLSADPSSMAEFKKTHEIAKVILAAFMQDLCDILRPGSALNDKSIKAKLYAKERELMSKQRPERVTVHRLSNPKNTREKLVEVNIVTPVNTQRTVSSAKKDEAGVANWLYSDAQVYSINSTGQIKKVNSSKVYRSASIVPHELLKQGKLSKALAEETAKRNIIDHIIPQLALKHLDEKDPIEINYELLTLLSPINALVDWKLDPDYAQFQAIRAAVNQFQGRTFPIRLPDGTQRKVHFNAIYHNYGVNSARGFNAEKPANTRAFNQVIERSCKALLENNQLDPTFINFLSKIPKYSFDTDIQVKTQSLYRKIEANNQSLSPKAHSRLLELHARVLAHESLTPTEKFEYENLTTTFEQIRKTNAPLLEQVKKHETTLEKFEAQLAEQRKIFFMWHLPSIEKQLSVLEKLADPTENQIEQTQHMRALMEYVQLVVKGYDKHALIKKYTSHDIESMTRLNYEIQSYIGLLSKHCNYDLHVTCKSGKDRSNAHVEKQKAKELITYIDGCVPKHDDPVTKKRERLLFNNGLLLGPGNSICGDNMKPAMQQLEKVAMPTDINVEILRQLSILQKGIDSLEISKEQLKKVHSQLGSEPLPKHRAPAVSYHTHKPQLQSHPVIDNTDKPSNRSKRNRHF